MSELVFPLLGTVFVFAFVLPAIGFVAKAALLLLERTSWGGPLHGLHLRYLVLSGSSLLPFAWLLSAAWHQLETGSSTLVCLFEHESATLCFEPGFFGLCLLALLAIQLWRTLRSTRTPALSRTERANRLLERAHGLIRMHPTLGALRARLQVTEDPEFAVGTIGFFSPRIVLGEHFAARLSDEMLASALGHEAEHVSARDPLRYWILQLSLALNPCGRFLLEPHAARWQAAREAHCDREAVLDGAAPLPLAQAILQAARPHPHGVTALGTTDPHLLQLRVQLLLAFAEQSPQRCCRRDTSSVPLAVLLLLIALCLPHQAGTHALDWVHTGSEYTLTSFWR